MDLKRRDSNKLFALGVAVFFTALAPYLQTSWFEFVSFDDPHYVSPPSQVALGLTPGSIYWALTNFHFNWHPITWLSLMLDFTLFGASPGAVHLDSAFLHACNAVLLFVLLLKLSGKPLLAMLVAALFAAHPLRVEAVAWTSARKDVLSSFFWLLTLLVYFEYVRRKQGGGAHLKVYVLCLVALALGLMSKGMLVSLPIVLLLLDRWPLRRAEPIMQLVVEKLPMFLLAAGGVVMTVVGQEQAGGFIADPIPLALRISNAVMSYATYLRQTLLPTALACFYPHPGLVPAIAPPGWQITVSAMVLLIITILVLVTARRWPWLVVGWLWYLVTLLPVIGIVQVGQQARADRYTYIPSIGLAIAMAGSMVRLSRRPQQVATVVAIAAILTLEIFTWRQAGHWRNSESLARHAVDVVPSNYVAHSMLSEIYYDRGDFSAAESELRLAERIKPDDLDVLTNLGVITANAGRFDEAEKYYLAAIARQPTAAVLNNYGNLLLQTNRFSDAVARYEQAIKLGAAFPQISNNLAAALGQSGNSERAIEIWKRLLSKDPRNAPARIRYADGLISVGRAAEGVVLLDQAVQSEPSNAQLLTALAWRLATIDDPRFQDGPRAVALAGRACELTRNSEPLSLDALAAAAARLGDFSRAQNVAKLAGELALRMGNAPLAREIDARRALYAESRPYTAPGKPPTTLQTQS